MNAALTPLYAWLGLQPVLLWSDLLFFLLLGVGALLARRAARHTPTR